MKFSEIDLEEKLLLGLDAMNFQDMTPVQEKTIPVILTGKDIIGCAQTGTGKTAAYTLPLLNWLTKVGNKENVVKAIIMVPTRELAQQIDVQFEGFSYFLPVSTIVICGGGDGIDWEQQKRALQMGVDIVIATPGRLISHIAHSNIDLSKVGFFILDEADRMLDMGFIDDIMLIVKQIPTNRQTILFSATLPLKIRQFAKQILHNPEEVNIAVSRPNESIAQSAYICYEKQKVAILKSILSGRNTNNCKTIIFSSSKQKVKDLTFTLRRMNINVAAMHSDIEQDQRESVMLDFKNGKISVVVATDIIARGIDIEDIGLIINCDVPRNPEDYIHRIGRTARASAEGASVTLVSESEQGSFNRIEKFLKMEIEKKSLPESLGEGPKYSPLSSNTHNNTRKTGGRLFNKKRPNRKETNEKRSDRPRKPQ